MVYRQTSEGTKNKINRDAMLQKKEEKEAKLSPSLRSMPPFLMNPLFRNRPGRGLAERQARPPPERCKKEMPL